MLCENLLSVSMNDTYLIHEDSSDPRTTTTSDTNDFLNQNERRRREKRKKCQTNVLFAISCFLTIFVIGGFGFLFGPLILQQNYSQHKFTPSQIIVNYYRLRLEPFISSSITSNSSNSSNFSTFQGRSSIIFQNSQKSQELRLISTGLTIESLHLTTRRISKLNQKENGGNYSVLKVTNIKITKFFEISTFKNETERKEVVIMLEKPLEKGDYMLDIHYSSEFSPSGLALSSYQKNSTKVLIDMKNPVFPFFDNNQKIEFELSVGTSTSMRCFTNVPIKETEGKNQKFIWNHFKPTPKILPTMLALTIGDFKSVNVSTASQVVLKMFTPSKPQEIHNKIQENPKLQFASEIFAKLFEYFEKYLPIYHLPKLDVIVIQEEDEHMDGNDFTSKLGLITLNANYFFQKSLGNFENMAESSFQENLKNLKFYAYLKIMEHFNDVEHRRRIFLMLSEAVAQQFLQIQFNFDEERDLIGGVGKFLAFNQQLIEENVANFGEEFLNDEYFVENILEKSLDHFGDDQDGSGELKIACILRMINYSLGNERAFQMGMSKFLLNSKDNFWEENTLENIPGKQLLSSWQETPGYPIITITRTTGWNVLIEQDSSTSINQNPVNASNSFSNNNQQQNQLFTIPLTYISKNNPDLTTRPNITLRGKQMMTNLFVRGDDWFLFNYNRIGYYRVNYQQENWDKLIGQLEIDLTQIPIVNRAGLIRDAFVLADEGLLQYAVALRLINYLRKGGEREVLPWKAAVDVLRKHEGVFLGLGEEYGEYRKFKQNLFSHLWPRLYTVNIQLSSLIEAELCKMQYQPCIHLASEIYAENKHREDVALPEWVICTVLRHPNYNPSNLSNDTAKSDEDFRYFYQKLQETKDPNEIRTILRGLTCSGVISEDYSFLEESFSNEKYARHVWPAMAREARSRLTGMAFLERLMDQNRQSKQNSQNSTRMQQEHQEQIWGFVIDEFLSTMTNQTELEKINQISLNLDHSLQRKLNKAKERVKKEIDWTERYLAKFIEAIKIIA